LTEEPEFIFYDDKTYALSWWPHQIYHQEDDELHNHEDYSLS